MTVNKNYLPMEEEPKKRQLVGAALVGKSVDTSYGQGRVLEFRQSDEVYKVQLTNGKCGSLAEASSRIALLYTKNIPTYIRTLQDEIDELNTAYEAMEKMRRLNLEMQCFEHGITEVEYDSCTTCLLRSKNAAAGERNRFPRLQKFVDSTRAVFDDTPNPPKDTKPTPEPPSSTGGKSFPNLRRLGNFGSNVTKSLASKVRATDSSSDTKCNSTDNVTDASSDTKCKSTDTVVQEEIEEVSATVDAPTTSQTVVLPRIQKLLNGMQRTSARPCLICANPVCSEHSSSNFRKENITLCLKCERLFELDFITECVSLPDPAARTKHIEYMIDCYDRCLLMLKYSTQHTEHIAASLRQQKERENSIGLGSSSIGMLSGVLGIAAAATILSPAGPPLLIASLFFGSGATVVQTGNEAYTHYSEPTKIADRVIALYGMALSILRVTNTLRDAMLVDHIQTDVYEAELDRSAVSESVHEAIVKNKSRVKAASNMGRAAALSRVAGSEIGATASASASATRLVTTEASMGARGASSLSRAGSAAARTIRFARFAGGALSAAVVVLEANTIQSTLDDIRNGNPCDKAEQLESITRDIEQDELPTTSELDEECQSYLSVLASRPAPLPEVQAEEITGATVDDFPTAECSLSQPSMDRINQEDVIHTASNVATLPPQPPSTVTSHESSSMLGMGSSFFQRVSSNLVDRPRGWLSSRSDEIVAVAVDDDQQTSRSNFSLVL